MHTCKVRKVHEAWLQVDFRLPVDIGDLLSFRSCVMHSRNLLDHPEGARGQIFVQVRQRPSAGACVHTVHDFNRLSGREASCFEYVR